MIGVVERTSTCELVSSFYRNFATLNIFGNVMGLGEAGRQDTLRAD